MPFIIDPGYRYQLAGDQQLQFLKKESQTPIQSSTRLIELPLVTTAEGTTNEEVLAVLIDRIQFLNKAFPCRENALAITKLEEGLMWLEARTKKRELQGVEGTALAHS